MQNKGFVKVFAILLTLVCVCDITDTGLRVLSFVFIRDPLSHEQGGRRPERRNALP